ncbi:MAG: hypothetical protein Q9177_005017, partial [Variospora cf. flavescens]
TIRNHWFLLEIAVRDAKYREKTEGENFNSKIGRQGLEDQQGTYFARFYLPAANSVVALASPRLVTQVWRMKTNQIEEARGAKKMSEERKAHVPAHQSRSA